MLKNTRTRFPHKRAHAGFTLIELMTVVGILGVIASIAIASYTKFVDTARGGAISANFEVALSTVKNNYVAARQLVSIGASPDGVIPTDSAGWANLMNTTGSYAPDGGPAFVPGAGDAASGAVGISFTGTFAGKDSVVTITRPAFAGLPELSAVVAQR